MTALICHDGCFEARWDAHEVHATISKSVCFGSDAGKVVASQPRRFFY